MKANTGRDMTIIRFPGVNVAANADPDPNHRLAVGEASFTCPSCDGTTRVNFHNMIFRSIEFYCASCGSPYRLTNPAFANVVPKTKR